MDVITSCLDCKSRDLRIDDTTGEKYCFNCGYVIEENLLEETVLNRPQDSSNFNTRTYDINTERFIKGTHVGSFNLDGTLDFSRLGKTLRRINQRSLSNSDRTLYRGITICNMLASELNASTQLKEQVSYNYKNLIKKQVFRGQAMETRAAAIIYYTYRLILLYY